MVSMETRPQIKSHLTAHPALGAELVGWMEVEKRCLSNPGPKLYTCWGLAQRTGPRLVQLSKCSLFGEVVLCLYSHTYIFAA